MLLINHTMDDKSFVAINQSINQSITEPIKKPSINQTKSYK